MGRPWWYDSFWKGQGQPPRRRGPRLPRRPFWAWAGVILLALVLAMWGTGFYPVPLMWLSGFVGYLCRILSFAVLIRAVLSWFRPNPYSLPMLVLWDITEPIVAPLRNAIPLLGNIDISPLVAILILNFIPSLFNTLLRWFV